MFYVKYHQIVKRLSLLDDVCKYEKIMSRNTNLTTNMFIITHINTLYVESTCLAIRYRQDVLAVDQAANIPEVVLYVS